MENAFPSLWVAEYVVPVSKPGKDSYVTDNQRPISLVCHTFKLRYKMMSGHLILVLKGQQAFSDSQSGFRQHHSTDYLLIHLDHDICEAYSNKNCVL